MKTSLLKLRSDLEANGLKVHIDTLYKAKRNSGTSKEMAKALEVVTGIPRLQWLYPDEYGDPWRLILN